MMCGHTRLGDAAIIVCDEGARPWFRGAGVAVCPAGLEEKCMRSASLRLRCSIVWLVFLIASTLVVSTLAPAQQKYVAPRINEPLEEGRRHMLQVTIQPPAR